MRGNVKFRNKVSILALERNTGSSGATCSPAPIVGRSGGRLALARCRAKEEGILDHVT